MRRLDSELLLYSNDTSWGSGRQCMLHVGGTWITGGHRRMVLVCSQAGLQEPLPPVFWYQHPLQSPPAQCQNWSLWPREYGQGWYITFDTWGKTMASIVSSLLTICSPGPLTLGQTSHHVACSPVERSRWEALKSLTKTQQGTGLQALEWTWN